MINTQLFSDIVSESQQTQRKIKIFNSKIQLRTFIKNPLAFLDISVKVQIPDLDIMIPQFRDSNMYIPKAPQQTVTKLMFPFYKKKFNTLFFLIGYPNEGIWNKFKEVYHEIIPPQQRPLQNMARYSQIQKIKKNLEGFIESGLQLKVIIQVKPSELKNLRQKIQPALKRKQVIKVYIQDATNSLKIVSSKEKIVSSMKDQFQKQIFRSIKGLQNLRDVIYYNFVNLQARSAQVFQRKNLIQEFIKPKNNNQHLKNHKQFTKMLQNYENAARLSLINKEIEKKGVNFHRQVQKLKGEIKKIQQQQKYFCNWLEQQLNSKSLIEETNRRDQFFFKIISQYKKEHSIYQIVNNGIRRSSTINQINVQCMSTFVKYLYEAIFHFFQIQKNSFTFNKVYRGARISNQQLQSIREGSVVMNLGFLSTSINQTIARCFLPKDNNGYMFVINLGEDFRLTGYQLEGFCELKKMYQKNGIIEKNVEQEVLFNPLNIFKIIKIDKIKRIITFQYAPHITLAKKTQNDTITDEEKKLFNSIKSNLSSLIRSNYDKGLSLHQKGQSIKALQHYQEAQKNGQILTSTQKFNKIKILNENKELQKVEIEVKKLIKELEETKEQKNLVKKLDKITNLNKQGQYLQMTSQFFKAQQRAKKANQQSKRLQEEILLNGQSSDQEILESFYCNAQSNLILAKSRYEKNENEKSIENSILGFKYIDELYNMYEKYLVPKIKKILLETTHFQKNPHIFPNIIKIRNHSQISEKLPINQHNRLKNSYKQQIFHSYNNFQLKVDMLNKYFENRVNSGSNISRAQLFQTFEQASYEIQNQFDSIASVKKAKSSLLEFKEGIMRLRSCQKKLYDVVKNNLKVAKKNLRSCLMSEKQNFYRLSRFKNFDYYIKKEINEQINLQRIKQFNEYSQFLMDYIEICQNESEKQLLKKISTTIVDSLLQKVDSVQKDQKFQGIKLTNTKTNLTQTKMKDSKNNCLNSNILEKAASEHSTRVSDNKSQFRTLAGSKNRKDFDFIRKKISQLQYHHKADMSINQIYFILKDLNVQIDLLNNSYSVAQSSNEYLNFLAEANQKYQYFYEDYLKKVQLRFNEQLAHLYILRAQNKLRRGYFKEAQRIIQETKRSLIQMYNSQDGENIIFNTLIARQIPVKLFRIQSQLIGIYGNNSKRAEVLEKLISIKKFVETKAPLNILAQALINQSVTFILIRYLPETITNQKQYQKYYKQGITSIEKSMKHRQGFLGDENQYLAIGYTFQILIKAKNRKFLKKDDIEQIKKSFRKGSQIFMKLGSKIISEESQIQNSSHMDKQPMLYIYKIVMQKAYNLIMNDDKKNMMLIYKQNIDQFKKNEKGFKSLQIVQKIFEAGQILCSHPLFNEQGEKYLLNCQQDLDTLNTINRDQIMGNNQDFGLNELKQIKYNLFNTFVQFYKKDSHKRKKYQKLIKLIEINEGQNYRKKGQLTFLDFIFNSIQTCVRGGE